MTLSAAPLKVLIACECSGTVRDAFARLGHDAWSCDLKPDERGSNRHIRDDVRNVLRFEQWDLLMVAHPPCTRLCNSGVRWLTKPPENRQADYPQDWHAMTEAERLEWLWQDLARGAALFSEMLNADVPRIAVENPVMHKHAKARIEGFFPQTQTVQPWQFATDEASRDNVKKRTCLWLKGLPKLTPTGTLDGSTARDEIHHASASKGRDRRAERARFFPGLAAAMAEQWGGHALAAAA